MVESPIHVRLTVGADVREVTLVADPTDQMAAISLGDAVSVAVLDIGDTILARQKAWDERRQREAAEEPYRGVTALFDADRATKDPGYAPREDWTVRGPLELEHTPGGPA